MLCMYHKVGSSIVSTKSQIATYDKLSPYSRENEVYIHIVTQGVHSNRCHGILYITLVHPQSLKPGWTSTYHTCVLYIPVCTSVCSYSTLISLLGPTPSKVVDISLTWAKLRGRLWDKSAVYMYV